VAADLIERSLFAFERSFSSGFNVTLGTHRLDFDRIENRPFFLGLHRHIQSVFPGLTPYSNSPFIVPIGTYNVEDALARRSVSPDYSFPSTRTMIRTVPCYISTISLPKPRWTRGSSM
jgi:hypothetical protein